MCFRAYTGSLTEILLFILKKYIFNCLELIGSIQVPWFQPSQPLTNYLESNGGLSLELSDEALIF
jgi:hypothetical protein